MVDTQLQFEKRLTRLGRKHRAMTRGYTTQMRSDGLIVAKPKRARMQIPLKGIFLIVVAFFGFKGFLLATLGPATYEDRLSTLNAGTAVERGGGWAMQIDPATQMVADLLGPVLR